MQIEQSLFGVGATFNYGESRFYNSYAQDNSTFYSTGHIPAAQNVAPTNAFETYAKHEREVVQKNPGVYEFCVEGNMRHEGDSGSATLADRVISKWINDSKAFDVAYKRALGRAIPDCHSFGLKRRSFHEKLLKLSRQQEKISCTYM